MTGTPKCAGCSTALATMRIRIRGCVHHRCAPCGAALLRRLLVIEPEHEAVVEPVEEQAADHVEAAA